MAKRLSYEERFERLKERLGKEALHGFFRDYYEFKEIEEGLIKEKVEQFKESEGKE